MSDQELLRQRYADLLKNREFLTVTERATADEESVSRRLKLATKAFADIS
jgi:hypothetical protein